MRSWSRALLILGILSIVCGFLSFDHWGRVPLPPEAHQPGWDSDSYIGPIGYVRAGIFLVGGGAICCGIARYLHGSIRKKGHDEQP
jgi:hypothetical protein